MATDTLPPLKRQMPPSHDPLLAPTLSSTNPWPRTFHQVPSTLGFEPSDPSEAPNPLL